MSGLGLTQERAFPMAIPIAGRRMLLANEGTTLPGDPILAGAIPAGYTDLGSIFAGKVDISVEVSVEPIILGRVPSPKAFYMSGQKGRVRALLEEYQPESVGEIEGGESEIIAQSGYSQVYLAGQLLETKRVLIFDDFDIGPEDDFTWLQYWWTTPSAVIPDSLVFEENKALNLVVMELDLKRFLVGSTWRLLEYRAIYDTFYVNTSQWYTLYGGGAIITW